MKKFKTIIKKCKTCDKILKLNNTRDIERKNFCSKSCSTKYYLNKNIIGMGGRKHTIKTKLKMSELKINIYAGKNNPRYIDGRTIFRERLLKEKEYKCVLCGSTEYLIAHHIIPCVRTINKGRSPKEGDHSISNGEFTCASCHKIHHLKEKENVSTAA